ncbi:hypothetical protein BDW_01915 [Bdellovibrio bacteriovorus W]|nr:hypothetical protein BDW_01915 [Bdellovibrio bacteriovorus W]
MKREENPWSTGIVMVCTKCHKAIAPESLKEEGNSGENLKNFLKKSLKESGDAGKIRVVTSSCLDVCIKDYQALSYAPVNGDTETFIVHPELEREKILSYLKSKLP